MDQKAIPLEKKSITVINSVTGKEEKLPALHTSHVRDINFLEYTLPTCRGEEVDGQWLESLQIINDDLQWLLSQSHWLFWSQVVFDVSLQKFLDSYLRLAPRPHDQFNFKYQDSNRRLIEEVNRRVFMVFLRLSTHKESKEDFISPTFFGDMIYQHFLFDIPKMFDLCSIYGQENSALLGKMISNIFTNQPRYSQDLMATVDSTYELLDQLAAKVSGKDGSTSQPLDSSRLAPSELTDWILFVADIFNTLHIFLLAHPPSCCVLQDKGFAQRLAGYYDTIIPVLQDKWRLLKDIASRDNWVHLKLKLRAAKKNMATVVHQLLTHCYVNAQASTDREAAETILLRDDKLDERLWEEFLSVLTVLIAEKRFLREFEKHFSIEQLIFSMREHHGSIDETNFAYIVEALQVKKPAMDKVKSSTAASHDPPSASHDPPSASACSNSSGSASEAAQSVKELFPHLEIAHIEKLISSYHGNTSAVIDAVLEGKIDITSHNSPNTIEVKEHADNMTAAKTHVETMPLLSARSNVYDHDEFDVFHHGDIDLSRVHIGKRYNVSEVSQALDDKSGIDALKKRITMESFDPYEDEYDDTYDTHNVGAADADSADEMLSVKRLNEKGLFAAHFENEIDSTEEDHEDITENSNINMPTDNVPHNSSSSKGSNQGQPKWSRGGSHHHKGSRDQFKKSSVSSHMTDRSAHNDGSQRGRATKERHKGSRANHNRKDRAQQKMRKGMF